MELEKELHRAIDLLINAATIGEAWALLLEYAHKAGIDHVIYGCNRLRRTGNFGERRDSFFLSDLPDAFLKKIVDEERYRTTAVAIWAMQNKGVVSLRYGADLYHAGKLPAEQSATQELFVEAGLRGGYVISFTEPGALTATAVAFLNFTCDQNATDAIWDRHGPHLQTLAGIFNLRVSNLPVPRTREGLTPRQKEVLQWVARGKTTSETASILHLSPATVEKHLRRAREHYGVTTTTQAVLFAEITEMIASGAR